MRKQQQQRQQQQRQRRPIESNKFLILIIVVVGGGQNDNNRAWSAALGFQRDFHLGHIYTRRRDSCVCVCLCVCLCCAIGMWLALLSRATSELIRAARYRNPSRKCTFLRPNWQQDCALMLLINNRRPINLRRLRAMSASKARVELRNGQLSFRLNATMADARQVRRTTTIIRARAGHCD